MRTNPFFIVALLLGVVSAQANHEKSVDPAKLAALKAANPVGCKKETCVTPC